MGKYSAPKVRDAKRANPYGGRHHGGGSYQRSEENHPNWRGLLLEVLQEADSKLNKLKKLLTFKKRCKT